jgi:hypothetical protein
MGGLKGNGRVPLAQLRVFASDLSLRGACRNPIQLGDDVLRQDQARGFENVG